MTQASPVQFQLEEVSPVEKLLKVEIAKEHVNAKLDEGFRQLNRQVNLKGFRKGHAPRSLLENMFGKRVGTDTAREMVNESVSYIIANNALRVASEPLLEAMPEAQKNTPLRFSARLEFLPQIEVKDYEGIEVSQREGKVNETAVDEALKRRQEAQIELRPIEGRTVLGETDTVALLLTGTLAHLTYKDREMSLDLSKPEASPLPGLAQKIVGLSIDTKDHKLDLTLPTEGIVKELAGKTGHFSVTIKSAHVKHLPALDDEFAKDLGETGVETLADLKKKIHDDLLAEDTEEAKHEMRIKLVEELIKRNPVTLPPNLVGKLARNLLENQRGRMQIQIRLMAERRKENPDAPFEAPTAEQLAQAAHAEAVRNLSIEFVMMALADKEKVEVAESDVDAHLAELAKERDQNVARVKAELQREDQGLVQLRGQLRLEKALDVLESKAVVNGSGQKAGSEAKTEAKAEAAAPADKPAAEKPAGKAAKSGSKKDAKK